MAKPPSGEAGKVEIAGQQQGEGWELALEVSSDRLTATARLLRKSTEVLCPPSAIVALVRGSRLRLSSDEEARLDDLAKSITAGGTSESRVVARGEPAGAWKDVEWLIPMGISSVLDYSNETVDLHEVSHFINVRKGQPLCEVAAIPKTGMDVYGDPIFPPPCPFHLGDRVGLDPKSPSRVIATEPGCARFQNSRLWVEQHLEIPGDLDFKIGNIDFFGDVTIRGNVLDGFHIKSSRNVTIGGSMGRSVIEAAGSITIKGGVNGGHKGRLVCEGDLQAHYLHMVTVECGGDILVDVECHDCLVLAGGSVTVTRGGIIGGKVCAGTHVGAGFIGTEMCVPTIIRAGHRPDLDSRVEKARKAVANARTLVKNLEATLHHATDSPGVSRKFPSQSKTQIIQLQSRLADARTVLARAKTELRSQLGGVSLAAATISSAKRIYPKVLLVIDSICEQEVANEIPGPVRLGADPGETDIKPR